MLLQGSVQDQFLREAVFRCVQNANTATATITAGSIAIGSPVVLATHTASLPSTVATNGQNFVQRPATATSIVNNLFVGVLAKGPRAAYLDREELGLAQCYGPYVGALIERPAAGAAVGNMLIPDSTQQFVAVSGPVTAAATATAGHVEVPALGGLAVLMAALATSGATETTTGIAFLRAM